LSTEVTVTAPADAVAGRHPVRARLEPAGAEGLPPSWGQVVEDVAVLTVGSPAGDLIRFAADPAPVRGRAGLPVRVESGAAGPIAVEAAVISPWGTWECVGPRSLGTELPAGGEVELAFDVE